MNPSHTNVRRAVGIFGKQGSGKTALESQIIAHYLRRRGKVIALDRQNQFPGHSVWPGLENIEDWLHTDVLNKHHGLLILDDADIYMTSRSKAVIRDMIASFRHYGLDIVVSARMPQGIDTTLLACLDVACIFRMTSSHGREHLERWLGDDFPGFLDEIPDERFKYLECDLETDTMVVKETVPM